MNMGNFVGAMLGIKLVNGKISPKYGTAAIVAMIIMVFFFILFCGTMIYGLINIDMEVIVMSVCGLYGFGYLLLISPYTQKSSNYYIEFQSENSLAGFKLAYKGRWVNIQYRLDNQGKFAFANNRNKLSCLSYVDGTKMSNLEKYKIINYFSKWLKDNGLLSLEVTSTLEQ